MVLLWNNKTIPPGLNKFEGSVSQSEWHMIGFSSSDKSLSLHWVDSNFKPELIIRIHEHHKNSTQSVTKT